MATIFEQIDDAELAARLGSINTFDRRGNVVFMEDFEGSTLSWFSYGNVPPAGGYLSNKRYRSRSQSCRMFCPDSAGNYGYIVTNTMLTTLSKTGLEVSFATNDHCDTIDLRLSIYTGGKRYVSYIRVALSLGKIQYVSSIDPTTVWTDVITGITFDEITYSWYTLKFVVDPVTGYWTRLLFGNQTEDMSDKAIVTETTGGEKIGLSMRAYTDGDSMECYFDNVIITQNEP